MANSPRSDTPSLADLRREIDRIDEAMHGLLIERSEIINRLIKVKKTQEQGSAFRPARESNNWWTPAASRSDMLTSSPPTP